MSLDKLSSEDLKVNESDVDTSELGLPLMGDKPVVGIARRESDVDVPVVREELAKELNL